MKTKPRKPLEAKQYREFNTKLPHPIECLDQGHQNPYQQSNSSRQQHLVTCHYAGDLTALLHSTSKGFSISTFYYHFPSPTPSCACILTCVHVCICACTHLSPPLHSCLCHHPYTPRTSHEKRLPSSTELGRGRKGSLTTTTLSISTAETKVQSSQNVQKFKNCVSLAFLPFHFYIEWHGKCIPLLTPAT